MKNSTITKKQYEEWAYSVHQALFHVSKTDMDATHNIRLDQLIILGMIKTNPEMLKYKPLKEILEEFDALD